LEAQTEAKRRAILSEESAGFFDVFGKCRLNQANLEGSQSHKKAAQKLSQLARMPHANNENIILPHFVAHLIVPHPYPAGLSWLEFL
jgi:hypothetical protein